MWKLSTLLKKISLEDAVKAIGIFRDADINGITQTMEFSELNLPAHSNIGAVDNILGPSYIIAAEGRATTLVTGDVKTAKAANKYVDIVTYADFWELYKRIPIFSIFIAITLLVTVGREKFLMALTV